MVKVVHITVMIHSSYSCIIWCHLSSLFLQNIVKLYNQDVHMSQKDAKINFLQLIYKWQTFGSAFFEVKVGRVCLLSDVCQLR